MAITSKVINLAQLDRELGSKGLVANFNDPTKKVIKVTENSDITEAQLAAAIAAHTAIDDEAVRVTAKAALLARLGITADEAKLLLS